MVFSAFFYSQVFDPQAGSYEDKADKILEQGEEIAYGKERDDGHIRQMAEYEGGWNCYAPDEDAVEDKGDKHLSAGAKGEIRGVCKGLEGHYHCGHVHELDAELPDGVRCVVKPGNKAGAQVVYDADAKADDDRKGDKLSGGVH